MYKGILHSITKCNGLNHAMPLFSPKIKQNPFLLCDEKKMVIAWLIMLKVLLRLFDYIFLLPWCLWLDLHVNTMRPKAFHCESPAISYKDNLDYIAMSDDGIKVRYQSRCSLN